MGETIRYDENSQIFNPDEVAQPFIGPKRPKFRTLKTRTNPSSELTEVEKKNDQLITIAKSVCYHDGKLRQFNSTWSPVKCTQCRCALNSVVDCYVLECPKLNCSMGFELDPNGCCPVCRDENKSCMDNGQMRKNGDYWTRKDQPCVHCSCLNGQISCIKENCTQVACSRVKIIF